MKLSQHSSKVWKKVGASLYWLAWPAIWLYLRGSKRTRVLVTCEDQFLVVKPWMGTDTWSLPGGGRHRHESAAQGAQRELFEETGLVVTPGDLRFVEAGIFRGGGLSFSYDLFIVQLESRPELKLQRLEIFEAKWVNRNESIDKLTTDVVNAVAFWPK